MWFQAKKLDLLPANILELPDLAEQLNQMQKYTKESYALLYTPQDFHVFRGDALKESLTIESVISDGLFCRRGDRSPRVIALTGDSKLVVELLVTGPVT